MFGYVRPFVAELKVREFEHFRSCYCSLCHELGKRYGLCARMILNYDFTFLAMLLWEGTGETCQKRCLVRPCRKACVYAENPALARAAGFSVILARWKLKDGFTDRGLLEKIKSAFGLAFLGKAYRRARRDFTDFDRQVAESLGSLSSMEEERETSLDKMADQFATLLSKVGSTPEDPAKERMLVQLLYHLGRWIYLTDAADDLKRDLRRGDYNVIASHYGLSSSQSLTKGQKEEIRGTLTQSSNLCITAFELMDRTIWTSIVSNILYLGLPAVCGSVLNGTYHNRKQHLPSQNGVKL